MGGGWKVKGLLKNKMKINIILGYTVFCVGYIFIWLGYTCYCLAYTGFCVGWIYQITKNLQKKGEKQRFWEK